MGCSDSPRPQHPLRFNFDLLDRQMARGELNVNLEVTRIEFTNRISRLSDNYLPPLRPLPSSPLSSLRFSCSR